MKKVPKKKNPWTKQSNPDFFPLLTFAPSDDENAILFNTLFRLLRLIAPITAPFRPVTSWFSSKAAISKNDNIGFNTSRSKNTMHITSCSVLLASVKPSHNIEIKLTRLNFDAIS